MSTEKRVTFNGHGDPKVVVTIEGWSDVIRFGWAIQHLQCDFCDVGRRIFGSLRKRLGAKEFRRIEEHYTGRRTLPHIARPSAPKEALHRDGTASDI